MTRATALVALVVLGSLVASATSSEELHCCTDHHSWGNGLKNIGCKLPEQNGECNAWCQSGCRGGECKMRDGLHFCHCYC
ncbi:putative defensin-like protein 27 [Triticum dicoccoides]|uniref:putative defensin-like protein 27 n=1 Tax=Triticum dicoccoides TaxID=85692 RepID=UPI00188DDFF9|nr:putative defensin-like protein 27 [Triticum dicoccoides]XP_037472034.1 putative defensin-like protein 27 [Triticum dicoccoides]